MNPFIFHRLKIGNSGTNERWSYWHVLWCTNSCLIPICSLQPQWSFMALPLCNWPQLCQLVLIKIQTPSLHMPSPLLMPQLPVILTCNPMGWTLLCHSRDWALRWFILTDLPFLSFILFSVCFFILLGWFSLVSRNYYIIQ